ncbi:MULTISPECIES: fatty acid desaturase [unclassified Halomonas]|uniref:fatty acid desaturase n=1 Tax=unclassified Halomonas TaxID=2609666 RepID=UPI0009ED9A2D|nr:MULTISPECIES: fatty acid desaturase [unclassified Halomonas]MBT2787780.1 fatty acid desaturase [Halomonas sp. ISL-106]MBT2799609.1 fatty acid desaturase [Halomonas sp. ISL-104]
MKYLVAIWLICRISESLRYRDHKLVYEMIQARKRPNCVRDSDYWFELASFLAVWSEILILITLYNNFDYYVVGAVVAIFVGGRFRALQEIGHTAIHMGFGRNKYIQYKMADVLGNYLIFKSDSNRRFISHCVEHHPNANTDSDPNVPRLRSVGLSHGISMRKFLHIVFHSFSFKGIIETASIMWSAFFGGGKIQAAERLIVNILVVSLVYYLGGVGGVFIYTISLVFIYPLFSWWSLLAEHRWFIDYDAGNSKSVHDSVVTQRTLYAPVAGYFVRMLVSPLTDSYHLLHHKYPRLHWKYSKIADRSLSEVDGTYSSNYSYGLFYSGSRQRSAIGDLYNRLVQK